MLLILPDAALLWCANGTACLVVRRLGSAEQRCICRGPRGICTSTVRQVTKQQHQKITQTSQRVNPLADHHSDATRHHDALATSTERQQRQQRQ